MYTRHIKDFMNTQQITSHFLVYSWEKAVISHIPGVYSPLPITVYSLNKHLLDGDRIASNWRYTFLQTTHLIL